MRKRTLLLLCLPLAVIVLVLHQSATFAQSTSAIRPTRTVAVIPVIDLTTEGYQPLRVALPDDTNRTGESDPANPYAVIRQQGPAVAAPGSVADFSVTLRNFDAVTQTYRLTTTLPSELQYVPDSAEGWTYDVDSRALTWEGEIGPGDLDYQIAPAVTPLPYLDLARFGVSDLCADLFAAEQQCANATVTFNLGINGHSANLYGEVLRQLTVTTDGLVIDSAAALPGQNAWLPTINHDGTLLAALWHAVDMGTAEQPRGRWHAAILRGLVAGHDVFYVQWHNAAAAANPNLTVRHALAVVLDGNGGLNGHLFYIYDNVSDPAALVGHGYTIGIGHGRRGLTYAYAPCCDGSAQPQGYPPPAGTTLHLWPTLYGMDGAFSRTFRYRAVVAAPAGVTVATTARAEIGDAATPVSVWSTHYLKIQYQAFLPVIRE